ncbi:hypothetical protein RUR49_19235 [Pseudoxanthobacter sp. M-2]|uniref:hypothetical protein n=1 Tax=Pseudoxanthobacter sp. M-2 TaxID=3078754 RepID=UPI0038FCDB1C
MTTREHPHDMLRRAEQFVTAAFLVTCPSEHGELDRRELEALNTVLGEGMVLLRDANAILQEATAKRADDRMVPRDAA